jgi:hypothetical protein
MPLTWMPLTSVPMVGVGSVAVTTPLGNKTARTGRNWEEV